MNPMDWLSWAYGKWFVNHTILGGFITVAIGMSLAFLLYWRVVEKYRQEHPKVAAVATLPAPTPPATKEQKAEPDKKLANAVGGRRADRPGPTTQIQQQSAGPNSPNIVAGTVNIGSVTPPERILSEAKLAELVRNLSGFPGSSVTIEIVGPDKETSNFVKQIRSAFGQAGWHIQSNLVGELRAVRVGGDDDMTVFTGEGFNCGAPDRNKPEVAAALAAFRKAELPCDFNPNHYSLLASRGSNPSLALIIGRRIKP